ncbi:MAG: YggS family pyridoxal phosphate-dependent enzyme [Desulfobacteraceae bacterium]|nr:MAG: YggS family pyridoxal phosphate-dependent enzyme [Desulfobacteraceae bacterium]
MQTSIAERLFSIKRRIEGAALRCGRTPQSVRLVAVTKTHPVELVRTAVAAGITDVGENYIQEARDKFDALSEHPLSWHFIGHLQSNKAKYAVRMFDLIHTVDSIKLAMELNRQAQKAGKRQHILIQVNLSGEATKSGVSEQSLIDLLNGIHPLSHIKVRGLMTMPPFFDDPVKARPYFSALRQLRDRIRSLNIPNIEMVELSMGMTGEFETAVEEGATLVRIGTALFGGRR